MRIEPVKLAERIEGWAQKLAPLGVAHWNIEFISIVSPEEMPTELDAGMALRISNYYDNIRWFVNSEWLEQSTPDEVDQTIIHEWVHVSMRDYDRYLDTVETWMPEATYTDFTQHLNREREGMVDRLATALFYAHKRRKPRFA